MRVLIVDDSRAMRLIVRRALRQAGYVGLEISEAGDGVEALERIRADAPDFVLCDWNMPRMSGIDLLGRLRAEGRGVRFGFVTTGSSTEMRDRAAREGALFLLPKPFTADHLKAALQPHVQ